MIWIIAILIGLIPAAVAQKKGYNFFLWWAFGASIFIVALPWAIIMKPKQKIIEQEQLKEDMKKFHSHSCLNPSKIMALLKNISLMIRSNTQELNRQTTTLLRIRGRGLVRNGDGLQRSFASCE